jgi:hypothetical protein
MFTTPANSHGAIVSTPAPLVRSLAAVALCILSATSISGQQPTVVAVTKLSSGTSEKPLSEAEARFAIAAAIGVRPTMFAGISTERVAAVAGLAQALGFEEKLRQSELWGALRSQTPPQLADLARSWMQLPTSALPGGSLPEILQGAAVMTQIDAPLTHAEAWTALTAVLRCTSGAGCEQQANAFVNQFGFPPPTATGVVNRGQDVATNRGSSPGSQAGASPGAAAGGSPMKKGDADPGTKGGASQKKSSSGNTPAADDAKKKAEEEKQKKEAEEKAKKEEEEKAKEKEKSKETEEEEDKGGNSDSSDGSDPWDLNLRTTLSPGGYCVEDRSCTRRSRPSAVQWAKIVAEGCKKRDQVARTGEGQRSSCVTARQPREDFRTIQKRRLAPYINPNPDGSEGSSISAIFIPGPGLRPVFNVKRSLIDPPGMPGDEGVGGKSDPKVNKNGCPPGGCPDPRAKRPPA